MRFFVTGVGGQLGHDVMNELSGRGHEGVGSDIAPSYSGIADGTPVTTMPYVQLDITDKEAVAKTIGQAYWNSSIYIASWLSKIRWVSYILGYSGLTCAHVKYPIGLTWGWKH